MDLHTVASFQKKHNQHFQELIYLKLWICPLILVSLALSLVPNFRKIKVYSPSQGKTQDSFNTWNMDPVDCLPV